MVTNCDSLTVTCQSACNTRPVGSEKQAGRSGEPEGDVTEEEDEDEEEDEEECD